MEKQCCRWLHTVRAFLFSTWPSLWPSKSEAIFIFMTYKTSPRWELFLNGRSWSRQVGNNSGRWLKEREAAGPLVIKVPMDGLPLRTRQCSARGTDLYHRPRSPSETPQPRAQAQVPAPEKTAGQGAVAILWPAHNTRKSVIFKGGVILVFAFGFSLRWIQFLTTSKSSPMNFI